MHEDYINLPTDKPQKTILHLSPKSILFLVGIAIAAFLAILSVVVKPKNNNVASTNEDALKFFNYLIAGQESAANLPEYKDDMSYYIETIVQQKSSGDTDNYYNHALELYDSFRKNTDLSSLDELKMDLVEAQHDDLLFLQWLSRNPAPTLDEVISASKYNNSDLVDQYSTLILEDQADVNTPAIVDEYLDKVEAFDSSYASDYAFDYWISIRYDLYEAAQKIKGGCSNYKCNQKITNDSSINTDDIDYAYQNFLDLPDLCATSIAASSYDILEDIAK